MCKKIVWFDLVIYMERLLELSHLNINTVPCKSVVDLAHTEFCGPFLIKSLDGPP